MAAGGISGEGWTRVVVIGERINCERRSARISEIEN